MDVTISRHNWKEFCKELPLSAEEWAAYRAMAHHMDDDLLEFMLESTSAEYQALLNIELTEDWADTVNWADANRRLLRAEIAVWKEWTRQHDQEKMTCSPTLAPG